MPPIPTFIQPAETSASPTLSLMLAMPPISGNAGKLANDLLHAASQWPSPAPNLDFPDTTQPALATSKKMGRTFEKDTLAAANWAARLSETAPSTLVVPTPALPGPALAPQLPIAAISSPIPTPNPKNGQPLGNRDAANSSLQASQVALQSPITSASLMTLKAAAATQDTTQTSAPSETSTVASDFLKSASQPPKPDAPFFPQDQAAITSHGSTPKITESDTDAQFTPPLPLTEVGLSSDQVEPAEAIPKAYSELPTPPTGQASSETVPAQLKIEPSIIPAAPKAEISNIGNQDGPRLAQSSSLPVTAEKASVSRVSPPGSPVSVPSDAVSIMADRPSRSANVNPGPSLGQKIAPNKTANQAHSMAATAQDRPPEKAPISPPSNENENAQSSGAPVSLPVSSPPAAIPPVHQIQTADTSAGPANSSPQALPGTSPASPNSSPLTTNRQPQPLPETPAPPVTISGAVQTARMVAVTGQAEMHIGVRSADFGSIDVHAVVRDSLVGVTVGSEKGDLRAYLSPEVARLQSTLKQQELRFETLRFLEAGVGSNSGQSGGGDTQSRYFSHGRHFSTGMALAVEPETTLDASVQTASELNVRA